MTRRGVFFGPQNAKNLVQTNKYNLIWSGTPPISTYFPTIKEWKRDIKNPVVGWAGRCSLCSTIYPRSIMTTPSGSIIACKLYHTTLPVAWGWYQVFRKSALPTPSVIAHHLQPLLPSSLQIPWSLQTLDSIQSDSLPLLVDSQRI